MELTINTNSLTFTDYLNLPKKLKKKNSLIMKRLRVKRSSRLLSFKKWFEKEHDYCLPIKENSPVSFIVINYVTIILKKNYNIKGC